MGLLMAGLMPILGAQAPTSESKTEEKPPQIERVREDVYRLGEITIDRKARAVSFPARINMDAALVEYFCVTEYGKIHEAVLHTAIAPKDLHTAILLTSKKDEIPPTQPVDPSNRIPVGCPVTISVSWMTEAGKTHEVPATRLLRNTQTKTSPSGDFWTYTSSRLFNGDFLADVHGDLIALMENIDALVNIKDEDRQNDELWEVNSEVVPPVGTPVEVTITLPQGKA